MQIRLYFPNWFIVVLRLPAVVQQALYQTRIRRQDLKAAQVQPHHTEMWHFDLISSCYVPEGNAWGNLQCASFLPPKSSPEVLPLISSVMPTHKRRVSFRPVDHKSRTASQITMNVLTHPYNQTFFREFRKSDSSNCACWKLQPPPCAA